MGKSTLAILVTLAVGLGVGYLLGGASGTPDRAGTVRSNTPRQQAEASSRESPRESPPESLSADASSLAAELHKLPAPSYAMGNGRITGVVKDVEGNGVAGVTVRATQRGRGGTRREGDGVPAERSLEDAVRAAVKSYHWRRQTTVDAVTDASGRYVVAGLSDDEYSLRAYLADHVVKPARGASVWNVRSGASIDWTASPVVVVPIEVILPDGSSPSQAWVQCRRGRETSSESWSPDRREISVRPGTYQFSVSVGGSEEFRSESIAATIEFGRAPNPITFRLVGRPGLRGNVRFACPERFSRLHVYAMRYSGDKKPSTDQLRSAGKEAWVHARDDYQFSLLDLPVGRYLVGVGARSGAMFATQVVDVGEQLATTELVVERIDPASYVVIRVLGPDGKPAEVREFGTSYDTGNSSSSGGSTWARRADGCYVVLHHDHNYEDGGTFGVKVQTDLYGDRKLTYKLGGKREFEIQFRAAAKVAVVVRGLAGAEHADRVTLGLRRSTGKNGWTSEGARKTPDADGRAVLGPVQSGTYEVVLFIRVGRRTPMPAVRQAVTLVGGESEVVLSMPSLHVFTVVGKKGEKYSLRVGEDGGGSFRESKRCGEDGRATFGPLPAGRYKLRRTGTRGEMELTVPCGEVVFKETAYDALRVSIQDPEGALAKAGLQDGDLVTAVNGTEFKGAVQMQVAFMGAMSKDDAKLTIQRGGRTMELTVDLKSMMTGGMKQGGSIRPSVR